LAIYTYEYYRDQANDLIEKFKFKEPPIDLMRITDEMRIEIVEMTLPSWFFGVLLNIDNEYYITLNKAMPDYRKKFTLAHEIAHFYLHGDELAYMKNCKRDYFHREADAYAAELCMPSEMVKKAAAKWFGDWRYLAKLFGVSEEAMVRKLQELGILKKGFYDCAT